MERGVAGIDPNKTTQAELICYPPLMGCHIYHMKIDRDREKEIEEKERERERENGKKNGQGERKLD